MSKKLHKGSSISGDPDDLNEDQRDLLTQFRSNISDIVKPDHNDRYLLKWLSARKYDIKKAEDMYRKSMAWRAEFGADTILKDFKEPEVMRLYYPGGLFGEDKEGRPLWIDPLGSADVKGILFSVKKSDIMRTMVYSVENLRKQFEIASAKHGRPIDQCLHIVDMTGFGTNLLWKPALDMYIDIVRMLEDNYPEILKRTYLINAPKVFKAAYTIFKTFIDEGTANKFVLLDSNWHDEVSKAVDASQLPQYYGGTQCDPGGDTKCLSRLCYGGKVPESFYKKKEDFFATEKETVVETIGRNGKLEISKDIKVAGSLLRWMFATDSGTVNFSVLRETEKSKPEGKQKKAAAATEVLLCRKEVECHRVPEDGTLVCPHVGTYWLVFENDGMFTSRKLTHAISVIEDDKAQAYLSQIDCESELIDAF